MTFKKPVILLIFVILFCVNVQASQPLESNTPKTNLDYDSIIDNYLDDFDLRPSRKETPSTNIVAEKAPASGNNLYASWKSDINFLLWITVSYSKFNQS